MEMDPNVSIVLPRHMPGKNPESLSWKNVLSGMIKKTQNILDAASQGIKKRFA